MNIDLELVAVIVTIIGTIGGGIIGFTWKVAVVKGELEERIRSEVDDLEKEVKALRDTVIQYNSHSQLLHEQEKSDLQRLMDRFNNFHARSRSEYKNILFDISQIIGMIEKLSESSHVKTVTLMKPRVSRRDIEDDTYSSEEDSWTKGE